MDSRLTVQTTGSHSCQKSRQLWHCLNLSFNLRPLTKQLGGRRVLRPTVCISAALGSDVERPQNHREDYSLTAAEKRKCASSTLVKYFWVEPSQAATSMRVKRKEESLCLFTIVITVKTWINSSKSTPPPPTLTGASFCSAP